MTDPQQRVVVLVSKFQSDLAAIAREIAGDVIMGALGSPNAASSSVNGHRSIGEKRDPKVLAALGDRFAAFVRTHPGLRIEQINKQIGATTAELSLPIRKLIASGAIKVKGEKRSTTYFAASAATSPKKVKAKTAPAKKTAPKKSPAKKAPKSSSAAASAPKTEPKATPKAAPN